MRQFWVRRIALDARAARELVPTTAALAARVGVAEVLERVVDELKDESEPFRRMVLHLVERVLRAHGAGAVDARLEERLVDGVIYAFQEEGAASAGPEAGAGGGPGGAGVAPTRTASARAVLDAMAAMLSALGLRARP